MHSRRAVVAPRIPTKPCSPRKISKGLLMSCRRNFSLSPTLSEDGASLPFGLMVTYLSLVAWKLTWLPCQSIPKNAESTRLAELAFMSPLETQYSRVFASMQIFPGFLGSNSIWKISLSVISNRWFAVTSFPKTKRDYCSSLFSCSYFVIFSYRVLICTQVKMFVVLH